MSIIVIDHHFVSVNPAHESAADAHFAFGVPPNSILVG
jgi:hypothetical protein